MVLGTIILMLIAVIDGALDDADAMLGIAKLPAAAKLTAIAAVRLLPFNVSPLCC
jgi:hypothetical protein